MLTILTADIMFTANPGVTLLSKSKCSSKKGMHASNRSSHKSLPLAGNAAFLAAVRERASDMGYELNDLGLWPKGSSSEERKK